MSDQTTQATTTQTTAPAATTATIPQADIAEITKQATITATAAAEKTLVKKAEELSAAHLKRIGQALSGGEPVDANKNALTAFAGDTLGVLNAVKEQAKKETLEAVGKARNIERVQESVGTKFINEYPELNSEKRIKIVEALASEHEAKGLSYKEALTKGFEDTVTELGLKSVTEAVKEKGYNGVGLPSGGGFLGNNNNQFNDSKSSSDFITSMKSRRASFVKKK